MTHCNLALLHRDTNIYCFLSSCVTVSIWYSFKEVSHSTATGGGKFTYPRNSGLSFLSSSHIQCHITRSLAIHPLSSLQTRRMLFTHILSLGHLILLSPKLFHLISILCSSKTTAALQTNLAVLFSY